MTEACCETGTAAGASCPACGQGGKPVHDLTVKALLTATALRRLEGCGFMFCANSACDVVYFSGAAQYGTTDVRVPVWQKLAAGDRTICYCFGENERDIQREICTSGSSEVASRVRAHIAAKRCACEVRNPRGVCCLGDVVATVHRAEVVARTTVTR